jgi:hypothetical protein
MSSNRLSYDTCAYKKDLDQSTSPLSYNLNPIKFENCSKCRMELGIVGGTAVSHIKGNLVDLENDLRGQTRQASLCPSQHYRPSCESPTDCQPSQLQLNGTACAPGRTIDTNLVHLPPCQMVRYKPVPLPAPMQLDSCPPQTVVNQPQAAACPAGSVPSPYNL